MSFPSKGRSSVRSSGFSRKPRSLDRRKSGVSPVIATTIILAITITLGLSLYSFVGNQTNIATQSFAEEVTDYLNYRNDRFVITSLSFKSDGCVNASLKSYCITANVFNNGDKPVTISQISFGDSPSRMSTYCIVPSTSTPINSHTMQSISLYGPAGQDNNNCTGSANAGLLALQNNPPTVYHTKMIADSGSYQSYFQKFE